jgi:integrase
MASILKDPKGRSPFWLAIFYFNRKQIWRSTKVPITPLAGRDEREDGSLPTAKELKLKAEEMARAIERNHKLVMVGSPTEANLRRIINRDRERLGQAPIVLYTIESWLSKWLKDKELNPDLSKGTRVKYEQDVSDFLSFLGPRKAARLDSISPDDFRGFMQHLISDKHRSPATVNQKIHKTLGPAFSLAWKKDLISGNPLAEIPVIKTDEFEKGTFTTEEVSRLVSKAPLDWKGVTLAGYWTGARLQDVANWRWENVELEAHLLKFRVRKTGKMHRLPIPPELEEHFLSLPSSDNPKDFLFPTLAGKNGAGNSGLSNSFKRIMEKAGISAGVARISRGPGGRSISKLSFHSLRHTCNSVMANAGVPQEIRRQLTGHSSDKMNDNYTHHDMEVLRQAMSALPRVGE